MVWKYRITKRRYSDGSVRYQVDSCLTWFGFLTDYGQDFAFSSSYSSLKEAKEAIKRVKKYRESEDNDVVVHEE